MATRLKLLILAFAALALQHAHGLGDHLASPSATDDERMDVIDSSVVEDTAAASDSSALDAPRGRKLLSTPCRRRRNAKWLSNHPRTVGPHEPHHDRPRLPWCDEVEEVVVAAVPLVQNVLTVGAVSACGANDQFAVPTITTVRTLKGAIVLRALGNPIAANAQVPVCEADSAAAANAGWYTSVLNGANPQSCTDAGANVNYFCVYAEFTGGVGSALVSGPHKFAVVPVPDCATCAVFGAIDAGNINNDGSVNAISGGNDASTGGQYKVKADGVGGKCTGGDTLVATDAQKAAMPANYADFCYIVYNGRTYGCLNKFDDRQNANNDLGYCRKRPVGE